MVYSEYSPENCKSLKSSIEAIIKNPEMLRFFTDYFKTKMMGKNVVKKLLFVVRYVRDQHKTQEICNKLILENGGTLIFLPDYYKH